MVWFLGFSFQARRHTPRQRMSPPSRRAPAAEMFRAWRPAPSRKPSLQAWGGPCGKESEKLVFLNCFAHARRGPLHTPAPHSPQRYSQVESIHLPVLCSQRAEERARGGRIRRERGAARAPSFCAARRLPLPPFASPTATAAHTSSASRGRQEGDDLLEQRPSDECSRPRSMGTSSESPPGSILDKNDPRRRF